MRGRQASFKTLALAVLATVATLACAEVGARLFLRYLATPEQFLRYASHAQLASRHPLARLVPHRHLGYVTTPNYRWGANRHNSLGFRGDEIAVPKPSGVYRIVCIGGSTTYSDGVLDHTKSYPTLLQGHLRAHGLPHVDVVNAGVPGYTSLESLINLQTRALDVEPDLVIFYENVNDVHARLVWPPAAHRGDYSGFLGRPGFFERPSALETSTLLRVFMVRRGLVEPHSSITRVLATPETSFAKLFGVQRRNGTYPEGFFREVSAERMLRENGPVFFERHLGSIVAVARSGGADVILATFAYSPAFPDEVTSHPEYQRAIEEGNQAIRRVASATGVYLLDLARLMPADPAYYTDGIHFTAAGNQLRARLLGEYIRRERIVGRAR